MTVQTVPKVTEIIVKDEDREWKMLYVRLSGFDIYFQKPF